MDRNESKTKTDKVANNVNPDQTAPLGAASEQDP